MEVLLGQQVAAGRRPRATSCARTQWSGARRRGPADWLAGRMADCSGRRRTGTGRGKQQVFRMPLAGGDSRQIPPPEAAQWPARTFDARIELCCRSTLPTLQLGSDKPTCCSPLFVPPPPEPGRDSHAGLRLPSPEALKSNQSAADPIPIELLGPLSAASARHNGHLLLLSLLSLFLPPPRACVGRASEKKSKTERRTKMGRRSRAKKRDQERGHRPTSVAKPLGPGWPCEKCERRAGRGLRWREWI